MKISSDESLRAGQIGPVSPVGAGTVKTAPVGAAGSGPAASLEISEQARTLAAKKAEAAPYLPAVHAAPDTRDDLVTKLKTQVDGGTYHVSGTDIADQILRRAKADNIQ